MPVQVPACSEASCACSAEDLVGIDISERMLEKAGERMRTTAWTAWCWVSRFRHQLFSAAVSVGVFTTNHAPQALDELVRVVEPDGWVIFSVRDDVYRKEGFEEKQALLEEEGRWLRVTMSEAFRPSGNVSHMNRLFVYKTG